MQAPFYKCQRAHGPRTWLTRRQRQRVPSLAETHAALPSEPQNPGTRKQLSQGTPPLVRPEAGPRPNTQLRPQPARRGFRLPAARVRRWLRTDNTPIALPQLYTSQTRPRPLHRVTPLPCVSVCRITRTTAPTRVSLALSALETDAPTAVRHPLARSPPAWPGEKPYVSQDSRVSRSSTAQRRPTSTAAPTPRTLLTATDSLSRISDTAPVATATSSHALLLSDTAEKCRAHWHFACCVDFRTIRAAWFSPRLRPTPASRPRVFPDPLSIIIKAPRPCRGLSPRAIFSFAQHAPRVCPAAPLTHCGGIAPRLAPTLPAPVVPTIW